MQIHELTHNNAVPALTEGLWNVAQQIFAGDPKFNGMSLRDRYRYLMTDTRIDNVANKAVRAWAGYVARKVGQDPRYLQNPAVYKNDLRLFVQKNLMAPGQTIDQMTNKQQLYQVIDQIVANRADNQGNPNPQYQVTPFNNLVDLATVSMTRDNAIRQQSVGVTAGAFTPQAAQQFVQNFGMSSQQLQAFIAGLRQISGSTTVASTGNSAVDNLLRGFGFTIT